MAEEIMEVTVTESDLWAWQKMIDAVRHDGPQRVSVSTEGGKLFMNWKPASEGSQEKQRGQ